jgi:hypothetical protein
MGLQGPPSLHFQFSHTLASYAFGPYDSWVATPPSAQSGLCGSCCDRSLLWLRSQHDIVVGLLSVGKRDWVTHANFVSHNSVLPHSATCLCPLIYPHCTHSVIQFNASVSDPHVTSAHTGAYGWGWGTVHREQGIGIHDGAQCKGQR